jgi:hypothetical protein
MEKVKVILANTIAELENKINEALKEGYKFQGNISVQNYPVHQGHIGEIDLENITFKKDHVSYNLREYIQIMIKDE